MTQPQQPATSTDRGAGHDVSRRAGSRDRPTYVAAAGAVVGALATWIAVLAYDGEANIRIDVPIFGSLSVLTVVVAAAACLLRVRSSSGGGRLGSALTATLAGLALVLSLALVIQTLDPGTPIWAKVVTVLGAALCGTGAVRLLSSGL